MDELVFMKFTGYGRYHTRNNLEHFGDVVLNLMETGFFPLFSGPVFVSSKGWGVGVDFCNKFAGYFGHDTRNNLLYN